jgi:hypothetical protein
MGTTPADAPPKGEAARGEQVASPPDDERAALLKALEPMVRWGPYFAGFCLALALALIAAEGEASAAHVTLIILGMLSLAGPRLLPHVQRISAAGVEVELARKERLEAEQAAGVARVYYSVGGVLGARWSGWKLRGKLGCALVRLADLSREATFGEFLQFCARAPEQTAELQQRADIDVYEMVGELQEEGLLDVSGGSPEDSTVRVRGEFAEPIRRAFGHYARSGWQPQQDS